MKRAAFLASLILVSLQPLHCRAEEGRGYVGGQVGMFLPIRSSVRGGSFAGDAELTYDPGIVVTATAGYRFAAGLRWEGEFNFRRLTTDKLTTQQGRVDVHGDARTYGVMTNLYYDFSNTTIVTPYIGAGIGAVVAEFSGETAEGASLWSGGSDTDIAYQGIAGIAYRVGKHLSIDLTYRHYAVPRIHFRNVSAQFRGPNLSAGLRYWF